MNFEQKFEKKIKIFKYSYTGLLCIVDPEYGDHVQQIWSFTHFLPQTDDFRLNRLLTTMDFV
jgi:hypothetical protein